MNRGPRSLLPVVPLLSSYLEGGLPTLKMLRSHRGLGERFRAISSASVSFLYEAFLDQASTEQFSDAIVGFYKSCASLPVHEERLKQRMGILRHALNHLLHGREPLPEKLARCMAPDGPYPLSGPGPSFWMSLGQALSPETSPAFTPAVVEGLKRLGLIERTAFDEPLRMAQAFQRAFDELRRQASELTALHCEHFLTLVARMEGRSLRQDYPQLSSHPLSSVLPELVGQLRAETSVRQRMKDRGAELAEAQNLLEHGLASQNGFQLKQAIAAADSEGIRRAPVDWGQGEALTLWIGRLWESDDPCSVLERFFAEDPIPGGGLWLPTAVLHLRDPQKFFLWNSAVRNGYRQLDDSTTFVTSATEQYRLANETASHWRGALGLHPFEVGDLMALAGRATEEPNHLGVESQFGGFCPDTFAFLSELNENNSRVWMERQRDRYRFVLRSPLIELCRDLAERYVEPVLQREHGYDLVSEARPGKALTSICKNDFGRGAPYCTEQWVLFCRPSPKARSRRSGPQFFVRAAPEGLQYGLRLGAQSRKDRRRLREQFQTGGRALLHALQERGAIEHCRLSREQQWEQWDAIEDVEALVAWSEAKEAVIGCMATSSSALVTTEELVGEIVLTFDRVLPLFTFLCDQEPTLLPAPVSTGTYSVEDFARDTFLDEGWLEQAVQLLSMKRQLILQGPPGTGKTYVARCLARRLAHDHPEAIRLVQFHPAYAYEEFVEGIKVRTIETEGRHDITYPVEEGVLCSFAAQAENQPSQPHILIIDEMNRGNLPRIFGELLFLLEYRDQALTLPYSRRAFRLPRNLYLLGTMNTADRSVAPIDQALRRRFSFLEMPPSSPILRQWLDAHPPRGGRRFAHDVVRLFESLNARLKADAGPDYQIGHSYFMVPDLTPEKLGSIWQHQIAPLLQEHAIVLSKPSLVRAFDDLLSALDAIPDRSRKKASASG